ncbi:DoxX family protein [Desertihabitans aurantiacus]|uniref:DoxX family protein n=1 Tax=Desertihabitans aurantiacus TaxID=2282477 RepID=UPI000DF7710F|nr:hypothetical protein [Desertihabitans aurantiacus]
MLFLIVLGAATTLTALVLTVRRTFSARAAARIGMAAAMAVVGATHLLMPTPFLQHLPAWVPARELLVAVSGVLETGLGAALLLRPPLRRRAGLVLAAYLVAIFPANAYVAIAGVDVDGQPGGMYPWVRLPFQLLFIAWAVWSTAASPSADPADLHAHESGSTQLDAAH